MIRFLRKKKLARDESGATLIEFAFVAPTFLLMLMGLFDLGYSVYMRSALTGAVQNAARSAALETGPSALTAIDDEVEAHVQDLNSAATVTFQRRSYFDYNNVRQPESFTDTNGNGSYDSGECFEDMNSNDTWDADIGEDGVGGPNDVVLYDVSVSYDRMFPFWHMIGASKRQTITSSTVLKNQPYGDQIANSVEVICT
ncbi:Flp pilus assembly protein TadG [Parasphingorhabdus marina DSM 22363]|uniref:Flp pilus assembly protein TadG n=1 Tax=Parasphingorhabdus marina DSM 22363 TaxID=1123272 RepID=A0A1N6FTI6_9SPHN|nr:TadE/TadG family type IV pilus assembly protein [Parasphingorhabdus marina]SIN98636.1 Flp pilus assembly protein TadG [Parasphingorhabdus marina DSM 22363]